MILSPTTTSHRVNTFKKKLGTYQFLCFEHELFSCTILYSIIEVAVALTIQLADTPSPHYVGGSFPKHKLRELGGRLKRLSNLSYMNLYRLAIGCETNWYGRCSAHLPMNKLEITCCCLILSRSLHRSQHLVSHTYNLAYQQAEIHATRLFLQLRTSDVSL